MRNRVEGTSISNSILKEKVRDLDCLIKSTGIAIVLTDSHPRVVRLNLTGSTNIQLPAPSTTNKGMEFDFINESTGAVVGSLTGSTGGALSAAGVFIKIKQNFRATARSSGADWYTLGCTSV